MSHARTSVVVVGAGPAGAVTALLLAREGIDVTVLDRARFPRAKPCGDCLSAAAATLLQRLGLLEGIEALAPAHLQGWRVHGPNRSGFAADFEGLADRDPLARSALALPRAALDHELLRQARAAGACVLEGAAIDDVIVDRGIVSGVRGRRDGRGFEVRASLTIGADGLRSRVSRRLHLAGRPPRKKKLSLTGHVQLESPLPAIGEMHVADGLCIGAAPVNAARTLVNLTLVADADRFGAAVRSDPHGFFAHVLDRCATLDPALREARPARLLASGPFDRPTRAVITDGAALVGDAAGYFDPFTGQGVHQAIAGAALLAAVARDALRADCPVMRPALEPYAAAHRRLVRGPRRVQRLVDVVLAHPVSAERVLRRLARRPAAALALLAVTGDVLPARALLSPSLLLSFLLPLPRAS